MTDLKFIAQRQRRRAYEDNQGVWAAAAVTGAMLGATLVGFIWIFYQAGLTCTGA